MTTAPAGGGSPPTHTFRAEVPTVHGDPDAARALATVLRGVADDVEAADRLTLTVVATLELDWAGIGAQALETPVHEEHHAAVTVAASLREGAAALSAYAEKLAEAHHHHGWSLGRLVTMGAIVTVGVAAVVVTIGAAGAVEAAAAASVVAEATEAAESAVTAGGSIVSALADVMESVSWLRPLLQFVAPKLTPVAATAFSQAGTDEATTGHIGWREVGLSSALTVVGVGVGARATEIVGGTAMVGSAPAVVRAAAPYAVTTGTWAGVSALDQEIDTGHVSVGAVAGSGLSAGLSEAGLDTVRENKWLGQRPPRDFLRERMIAATREPGRITDVEVARSMATLRTTDRELLKATVDLRASEGVGHTLGRHVDPDLDDLMTRLTRDRRVRLSSGYTDEGAADAAVQYALRTQHDAVQAWIRSGAPRLTLRTFVPFDAGIVVDRTGTLRLSRCVRVVLGRDELGRFVLTSFPDVARQRVLR